jgi:omega-6 fatty acid desaturase (delta-12 desaturase)
MLTLAAAALLLGLLFARRAYWSWVASGGMLLLGWLFYVQHQFEDTYFVRQGEWTFHASALEGSTYYDLPAVLSWFTANIGAHPVHHLASRIPSYRLPEVLADHPELRDVGRLTFSASLKCFRLALWDEEAGQLVPFRALRKLPA